MTPFRLNIPPAQLDDLARRLAATRWPAPAPAPSGAWRWGADPASMRALADHWQHRFQWRDWEARLNAHAQYVVEIDGCPVHCLVAPGSGPSPLPLLMTHGWPGSVFELLLLVEPLAHPERFGGSASDAFTVVLPSIPGFGFAPPPPRVLTPQALAAMWKKLMTQHLGFSRYVAHGGDTGATITSWMGLSHDDSLSAIHLNTSVLFPVHSLGARPPGEDEQRFLARQQQRLAEEEAYQHVHAEKPLTLAHALSDSPVGLAAWITEKFHGWTDPSAQGLEALNLDALLANICTYWFAGPQPVHWLYQTLRDHSGYRLPAGCRVETPTGFCLFPQDIAVPPPRAWLERSYHVQHLRYAPQGGHFPAMEQPDLLAEDLRAFFRPFR